MIGVVLKSTGSWYVVRESTTGQLSNAASKANFASQELKVQIHLQ